VAAVPLKVTLSLVVVVLKLVPVMVTVVLYPPESGVMEVMVGVVGPVGPVGPVGLDGDPDLPQPVAISERMRKRPG
jgi:hypothetical protein